MPVGKDGGETPYCKTEPEMVSMERKSVTFMQIIGFSDKAIRVLRLRMVAVSRLFTPFGAVLVRRELDCPDVRGFRLAVCFKADVRSRDLFPV